MTWASATIAVISACVCLWYAAKAVRTDREQMRRGRDAVWQRRIESSWPPGLQVSKLVPIDETARCNARQYRGMYPDQFAPENEWPISDRPKGDG